METDLYALDSIDLLQQAGIDFSKNRTHGVDIQVFSELLMTSGLVLNEKVLQSHAFLLSRFYSMYAMFLCSVSQSLFIMRSAAVCMNITMLFLLIVCSHLLALGGNCCLFVYFPS